MESIGCRVVTAPIKDFQMTKTFIRNALQTAGIYGVVTTRRLADVLRISVRTIGAAKNRGELRQIDRNTFELESIVEWLYAHPRYFTKIDQSLCKPESR